MGNVFLGDNLVRMASVYLLLESIKLSKSFVHSGKEKNRCENKRYACIKIRAKTCIN